MARQTWQKWDEFKITTWDSKNTVWEIEITIREWKTVMRDHNCQSRTKNCYTRFIVTVENRCMRKKITIREYRLVFFWAAKPKQSAESILEELSLNVIEKDVRYFKCVQDSSKGDPPLAFLPSTGGRPAYIITKKIIEQLRENGMKWRSIATRLWISEQTLHRHGIEFGVEINFTGFTILPQIGRHMELIMMVHWLTLKHCHISRSVCFVV